MQTALSVVVNRTGEFQWAMALNFATSDTAGLQNCTVVNGIASERCDYATTVGTLRFAAGETSKTIIIPLVNDALVEGNESFTLRLSFLDWRRVGNERHDHLTINDNDSRRRIKTRSMAVGSVCDAAVHRFSRSSA